MKWNSWLDNFTVSEQVEIFNDIEQALDAARETGDLASVGVAVSKWRAEALIRVVEVAIA